MWDPENGCFIPRIRRRAREVIAVDSSESVSVVTAVEVEVGDVSGENGDVSSELDLNMDGSALCTWLATHDVVEGSEVEASDDETSEEEVREDGGMSEEVCVSDGVSVATHSTEEGVDASVDGSTIDDEMTEEVAASWTGPDKELIEGLARSLRETHPVATVGDLMAAGAVCLAMVRRYGDDVSAWRVDWDVHFPELNRVRVGGSERLISRAV